MKIRTHKAPYVLALLLILGCNGSSVRVASLLGTDALSDDPDDPAIWINHADPARSLILGTIKVRAPKGALVVYGLDGKIRQMLRGIDRPNNVDVEYGLKLRGQETDIAVVTERLQRRLRVFRMVPDAGGISDISPGGGLPVFDGEQGENAAPMGIALYKRPHDGTVFAVVGRKAGPGKGYLWQYRLEDDGTGHVKATKVRAFGQFSGTGEIEAIAVDDALGYVYYADEGGGIHKWHADPDHPDADRELAQFGLTEFSGDREGIAIYARTDRTGYIICTDQLPRDSAYLIYPREGKPGNPHDHSSPLKIIRGGADSTDGIEATSVQLGAQFPSGLFVAMNSRGKNFLLYRWEDIAHSGKSKLKLNN